MTPMASKIFRHEKTITPMRTLLADAQFFECSNLYQMAGEMISADLAAGCLSYSDFAQLPAPICVFEWVMGGGRAMALTVPQGSMLEYFFFSEAYPGVCAFTSGFEPGTITNAAPQWDNRVLRDWSRTSSLPMMEFGSVQASGTNALVEKFLCMINQPGLIDRRPRDTDSRVVRESRRTGRQASLVWHECRIRPGHHSGQSSTGLSDNPVMPLHYVRKYFKPSVKKWVDGYWRGDIALGLHLKWYSPRLPVKEGVTA